jgi:hypothetical protein
LYWSKWIILNKSHHKKRRMCSTFYSLSLTLCPFPESEVFLKECDQNLPKVGTSVKWALWKNPEGAHFREVLLYKQRARKWAMKKEREREQTRRWQYRWRHSAITPP